MSYFTKNTLKEYSIFFWTILVSILAILIFIIYTKNKEEQTAKLFESLENIYLKKTIQEITKNLDPRFTSINYISKSGDTYENIVNDLKIGKNEKKLILNTILKEKDLKTLRTNQKFTFKFDKLSNQKIVKFVIETDKKNELIFIKDKSESKFISKKIKKNFKKKLVYKETIIKSSLYNSAIDLEIKPNVILEFARLYGFQIDFQRDIWKNDSFQIIYEQFTNKDNVVVDNTPTYRKLTPKECERLQTFPDDYTDGISKTQRYKCLGNSFTVDVIAHILSSMDGTFAEQPEQLEINI